MVIVRAAIEDDEILGYPIPKGSNVMLSQWFAHRHPSFWENPERFEPERFLLSALQEDLATHTSHSAEARAYASATCSR